MKAGQCSTVKAIACILAILLAVVGSFFLAILFSLSGYWEKTLSGPFGGQAYAGSITSTPTSVLSLPTRGRLEVHELKSYTNPVLVLRSPAGQVQWARLLLPEKKGANGSLYCAGIRDLRLQSWKNRSTGSVVSVVCDWDWGGREGGLILLDTNYGFTSFSLSW